jgi:hypothetical protein
MPEGIVQVTEGSGKKLHTWQRTIGANSVEDEFILHGEYPYPTYGVQAEGISIATTNDHVLQLMAGSSLNVRIRRIYIEQSANATAAGTASMQILRLTTAGTGGGALTPAKFNTGDAAAGATAMTLPTAKGTESTVLRRFAMAVRSAATSGSEDYHEWEQLPNAGPIVIPAGTTNGIAVKILNGIATTTSINVYIEFVETAF